MNASCLPSWTSSIWALLAALAIVAAQEPGAAAAPRFATLDVYVDGGDAPLAAWQVEVSDPAGRVRIVGVEGGEHPAYAAPPRYDPRALRDGERIVLAAFRAQGALPRGRTRVASLQLRIEGATTPDYRVRLQAAADPRGTTIDAEVSVAER